MARKVACAVQPAVRSGAKKSNSSSTAPLGSTACCPMGTPGAGLGLVSAIHAGGIDYPSAPVSSGTAPPLLPPPPAPQTCSPGGQAAMSSAWRWKCVSETRIVMTAQRLLVVHLVDAGLGVPGDGRRACRLASLSPPATRAARQDARRGPEAVRPTRSVRRPDEVYAASVERVGHAQFVCGHCTGGSLAPED